MLDMFNPLKWLSFNLALAEISLAIFGSLMRTHFGED